MRFPASREPSTAEVARAVAGLAEALATGDAESMGELLTSEDARILAGLVESGRWSAATEPIESVRVAALNEMGSVIEVGLAVQEPTGAYLLGWEGVEESGGWRFRGMAIEPREAPTADALDGAMLTPPMTGPMGGEGEDFERSFGPGEDG